MALSSYPAAVQVAVQILETLAARLEVRGLSPQILLSIQAFTFVFRSGASAAAVAVLMIALAFAMLRWSRRQNCLYHNNELGEVVPSLSYRKRSADVETASVDSFESDVSV